MTPEERYAKRRHARRCEARSARNRRYYLAHRDRILTTRREARKA